MRRKSIRKLPDTARRAFTLVEMLVVMGIIAALVALSASAVLKFIVSQQVTNTQATMDKTQSVLNRAWSKVKDEANKAPMTEIVPGVGQTVQQWIWTNLASNATYPNDPNVQDRIRVLYVKLRLRQAFPLNFTEALNPFPLPPLPAYYTYLTKLGITGTLGANYEASACLLMALQRGVSGKGIDPSDLTTGGQTGAAATPNGGSIPYLTDAWGMPIYFTRVPAGIWQVNGNPFNINPYRNPNPMTPPPPTLGQPGNNDPLDPQGYLQAAGWATNPANGQTTPQANTFELLTQQALAGLNRSFMLAPMLCSSGPDKTLQTDANYTFTTSWFAGQGIALTCFYGYTFAALNVLDPRVPSTVQPYYGDDLFSTP